MQRRIVITGNLVANAESKTKENGDKYYFFTVASNKGQNEDPICTTCFVYGISEDRAKLLTTGSLVYCYGIPTEEMRTVDGKTYLNRTLSVKDFEILFYKKPEA